MVDWSTNSPRFGVVNVAPHADAIDCMRVVAIAPVCGATNGLEK